jgi:cupin 2 domain-containing protein
MIPEVRNLFTAAQPDTGGEVFQKLLEGGAFRLESITSRGTASDKGFWYDQPESEWVLLVRGTAALEFDGGLKSNLATGDYLLIPQGCRHRVDSVSTDAVWLAIHVSEPLL